MAKIKTTVLIEIEGAQIERDCRIEYARHKGYPGDQTDPPEADSVEVTGVEIAGDDGRFHDAYWLCGVLSDDDEIQQLLLLDWTEDAIAAEEAKAEDRREMSRDEGGLF